MKLFGLFAQSWFPLCIFVCCANAFPNPLPMRSTPADLAIVISAESRNFIFPDPVRLVDLDDNLSGVDLNADPYPLIIERKPPDQEIIDHNVRTIFPSDRPSMTSRCAWSAFAKGYLRLT